MLTEAAALLDFPAPREKIAQARSFRTTWIVSSLQSLRARGHYEAYLARLPSNLHAPILGAVAGVWMPIDVARSHYEACDALGLSLEEQVAMGSAVGARAHGSLLATAVRAARGIGVTPWTIFPQFDRLWRRGADGGAAAVFRVGPKEARAEFVGCELLDLPYFRNAFRGVLLGVVSLFCVRGYVHEVARCRTHEAVFRFQWA